MRATTLLRIAAIWITLAALPGAALAQEAASPPPAAPPPPLEIESIAITPATPAVDTLCRLRLAIRSTAERPISALAFQVELGGVALTVYDSHLFFVILEPGELTEVPLYNFWTTETGRPAPPDGKLLIGVTLLEAKWVHLETADDGTETWTVGEDVPGLPVAKELTVELGR